VWLYDDDDDDDACACVQWFTVKKRDKDKVERGGEVRLSLNYCKVRMLSMCHDCF
jgi:hypothetical protein